MISLLTFLGTYGFAQLLDVPVATVRLTSTQIITQNEFRTRVQALETQAQQSMGQDDKTNLLDLMVAEVLIRQAAARANIRVTEAEVIQLGKTQLNLTISDAEFRTLVAERTGVPWSEYLSNAQETLRNQRFVMNHPSADFSSINVTQEEVEAFYEENRSQFINPDLVRISHIYFDTVNDPQGTEAQIRARAEEALEQINDGEATFEALVRTLSNDRSTQGRAGDLGFLARNDQNAQGLFGRAFVQRAFRGQPGEIYLAESNVGFTQ